MKTQTRNRIAMVMLAIGSLQMVGYIFNQPILRGLGAASGIAPFTKVFCEAEGYEAFAASFYFYGQRKDGTPWYRELSPEWYSQLEGPYNRRNVYGAALAFAPRLPEDLRDNLIEKSLTPGSALRKELGVPEDLVSLQVMIVARPGAEEQAQESWTYQWQSPAALYAHESEHKTQR